MINPNTGKRWKRSDLDTKTVLWFFSWPLDLRYPTGETIQANTGAPEKVVWAAMEREENKGFIDYGTWLHGAWLTHEGWAELARLTEK